MLAEAASFIGSVAVLFTLAALVAAGLWIGGRPRAALLLLLVMCLAAIVNNVVKLDVRAHAARGVLRHRTRHL